MQTPTEEGKRRYPPDGYYDAQLADEPQPCVCTPACPKACTGNVHQECTGEPAGCPACKSMYDADADDQN